MHDGVTTARLKGIAGFDRIFFPFGEMPVRDRLRLAHWGPNLQTICTCILATYQRLRPLAIDKGFKANESQQYSDGWNTSQ